MRAIQRQRLPAAESVLSGCEATVERTLARLPSGINSTGAKSFSARLGTIADLCGGETIFHFASETVYAISKRPQQQRTRDSTSPGETGHSFSALGKYLNKRCNAITNQLRYKNQMPEQSRPPRPQSGRGR